MIFFSPNSDAHILWQSCLVVYFFLHIVFLIVKGKKESDSKDNKINNFLF